MFYWPLTCGEIFNPLQRGEVFHSLHLLHLLGYVGVPIDVIRYYLLPRAVDNGTCNSAGAHGRAVEGTQWLYTGNGYIVQWCFNGNSPLWMKDDGQYLIVVTAFDGSVPPDSAFTLPSACSGPCDKL